MDKRAYVKLLFALIVISFFYSLTAHAAQWVRTYGGSNSDYLNSIIQISDGGLIFAGTTSFGSGGSDIWVVKLDLSGNILWQKAYGGDYEEAHTIQQTSDGGYIVAGITSSTGIWSPYNVVGADILILKLDLNGNILWQKVYGGSMELFSGKRHCRLQPGLGLPELNMFYQCQTGI